MTDYNKIMQELAEYTRMQEATQAIIDGLKDDLKSYMQERGIDTITGAEHKCSWKEVTSSRIDTAALKKALPEVAQAYTKETKTRRFIFA